MGWLSIYISGMIRAMKTTASANYWLNMASLARRQRLLRPLVVTYYLTTRCNLNCVYCEDFGARRNAQAHPPVPLEQAMRVLGVIRTATDAVILTGGEPLLHPQIDDLVEQARLGLGLRLTMLTNASLLHQHEAVLPHLERLVISLDMLDPVAWSQVIHTPVETAQRILENIQIYAAQQKRYGYRLILNCVVTPQTLAQARELLDFARAHHVLVSFSPQAVQNWPHYGLLVEREYKDFLTWLLQEKERGAPLVASRAYLRTLLEFKPYSCYPTLAPRVLPDGGLIYPCRPVERDDNGHGGRPCNLLEVSHWEEAARRAVDEYGQPPTLCSTCFQQCYAESSLMQTHPLGWLEEVLRFPPARQADLITYAPG